MDEDIRTLWCGNLSDQVTEEILYELFLQGGPVQRVAIPKDRDGKQRSYGFVTYKHISSVSYALVLFNGTKLFNRPINMKTRSNVESSEIEKQKQEHIYNLNHLLNLGQQTFIGNFVSNVGSDMLPMNVAPNMNIHSGKIDTHRDDRHSRRNHPYQRDHENNRRDHHKNNKPYKNRNHSNSSSHSNDYSKHRTLLQYGIL
ncbi:PREDICTED: splicing regulator RBM11 [Polistes dominula]|uniref:Splicing regulator RBM11 n=1 Tax=Polistes dominula TaxID=743375 RepID=A0ABM1J1Y9_POLDO|nr:PREDICTED: splicing regulator RBM11 [Polistes dominula]XP_015186476.1 PREDICTED: splicing regulator RBM11 [Polistes dominula]